MEEGVASASPIAACMCDVMMMRIVAVDCDLTVSCRNQNLDVCMYVCMYVCMGL